MIISLQIKQISMWYQKNILDWSGTNQVYSAVIQPAEPPVGRQETREHIFTNNTLLKIQ